ncbi:hypothetical protein [Microseira sp. BLCC-F43]|jgi:hypothetical protein|uniref:hypothetical protein n=1 Tax=Microseira sp. BLCC-F43 TaxID=3153602 RepID=UPI0035B77E33
MAVLCHDPEDAQTGRRGEAERHPSQVRSIRSDPPEFKQPKAPSAPMKERCYLYSKNKEL